MNRAPAPTRFRAAVALAWACLAFPAFADEAPPPSAPPPVCGGRDLSRDAALHPQALARANAQRREQLADAQGILWRVEKPGVPASALFGTIHSTDDRATAIARSAAAHIRGARIVATELGGPFDRFALAELGAKAMVKALARDGDTLAGLGSPDEIALVEKYLAGRGIGADFVHHLRPWFLVAATSSPSCEIQRQQLELPVVDEIIARTGKDLGVKVVALETMEEQTDALSSIAPSLAAAVLISAAKRPSLADDAYATLLDLYAQQKPAEVLPILDASLILTPEEVKAEDEVTNHLLESRNKVMVERMRPLLDAGGAFVAVGALHLVGKKGLIELLRGEGFVVTPMS